MNLVCNFHHKVSGHTPFFYLIRKVPILPVVLNRENDTISESSVIMFRKIVCCNNSSERRNLSLQGDEYTL